MPNNAQRKNLKIKLQISHDNIISGLSHSKLTNNNEAEYFFYEEKSAQAAIVKFQMQNISVVNVADALGNQLYKVKLTAQQFGQSNIAMLRQFYLWLNQENLREIKSKLPTLPDTLIADLMLLVSDDNENLLTKAITSNNQDLANMLIARTNPETLSLALLHPLDEHGLFPLITYLMIEPSFKDLAKKSLEKITQTAIDCLLHIKDLKGYSGFACLAKKISQDNLDLIIEKASIETIDDLLLLQMNPDYTPEKGFNGFFLVSKFHKETLNKIIKKATTQTLNQAIISKPLNNNVQTNGLQAIILNSDQSSFDILLEMVSSDALKIALMQRNHSNQTGLAIAVNSLTEQNLSKLLKKLHPDWIEDLTSVLTVSEKSKVLDILNNKEEKTSASAQNKIDISNKDKINDKSLETLLSEIKTLNNNNRDVQKLVNDDILKKQLLTAQESLNHTSSLASILCEDGKTQKLISKWAIADCKKWSAVIKSLPEKYDLKLIPDEEKLVKLEVNKGELLIKIDQNGSLRYITTGMVEPKSITKEELKACDNWNAINIEKYKQDILALALKRGHIKPTKLQAMQNSEVISVIIRAVELFTNYQPREVQLLSLLSLLQAKEKGRLAQISTGEGKSLIVAMLAIIKVLMGQKVDVITSSPLLAERDAKEHHDLYAIFDIAVSHNWDKQEYHSGLKKCYQADVVYGDNMGFQWDLLRHEYLMENTRGKRPYNSVIVDEVDSMLIDGHSHTARLSSPKPSMEYFGLLFVSAWQELVRIEQQIHLSNEHKSISDSDKEKIIKKLLKDYLTTLIKDDVIYIPKHLKELALYLMDNWIESAITARYKYVLDRHYAIALDKEKKTRVIAPIDYRSTGIIQNNMHWDDGLQQFLQIKHNLTLESVSLEASFISNTAYFKRYGSNIYGMTGTLGSGQTQELLQYIYPIDLIFIPTFRHKRLVELPGVLCDSNKEWLLSIRQKTKSLANKSAALIICESINAAKQVEATLKEIKEIPTTKIKSYTRNDNEECLAISQTMTVGDFLIATNLAGRGADINTSALLEENDGLTVITTFLPENKRIEDQASGRTARKGNKGKSELIIDKVAILPKLISECPDHKEFDTIKDIKDCRDKIEIKRLDSLKKFEFERVTLQDQLFSQFCKLTQDLRAKRNDKDKLSEIEDMWSFWLKKWTDKIETERAFDKDKILKDFSALAEKIKTAYDEEFKNPIQLVLKANKTSSIVDYTKAIAQDPIVCFQAFYNRAFARIKSNSENCRQEAVNDLLQTRSIISDTIIPQIHSMQVLVNLTPGQQTAQTDLIQQLQTRIDLYQLEIQNIDTAVEHIKNAASNSTFAVKESSIYDFVDKLPRHQQAELYQSGLKNLFEIQEVKHKTDWLGVFGVIFLGVLQIAAGVFVTFVPGLQFVGTALISEGIGDIMYAVRSALDGTFSFDDYLATKTTSIAVTIITLGMNYINAGLMNTLPQQFSKAPTMDLIKSQITKQVITTVTKEAVSFGLHKFSDKVLDNFKDEITHQVKKTVMSYLSHSTVKTAIDSLIAADLRNGNMVYGSKMKQLTSEIIRAKQAVSHISMNIVKGALSNQDKTLATLIKIADMGYVLQKITSLAESFCEDFANGVKIMAQSLPASGQEHNGIREKLFNSIADIIAKCIMASLHGQIINPATDLATSGPLSALSDNIFRLTQAEDKGHNQKKTPKEVKRPPRSNPTSTKRIGTALIKYPAERRRHSNQVVRNDLLAIVRNKNINQHLLSKRVIQQRTAAVSSKQKIITQPLRKTRILVSNARYSRLIAPSRIMRKPLATQTRLKDFSVFSQKENIYVKFARDAYYGNTNVVEKNPPVGYKAIEAFTLHSALSQQVSSQGHANLGIGINPSPAALFDGNPPWRAILYQNESTKEYVVSFRGTAHNANRLRDWFSTYASGDVSTHEAAFIRYVHQEINKKFPNAKFEAVTGHSEGAVMGCEFARQTNTKFIGFCAPSLRGIIERSSVEQRKRITLIQAQDDPLSSLNKDSSLVTVRKINNGSNPHSIENLALKIESIGNKK